MPESRTLISVGVDDIVNPFYSDLSHAINDATKFQAFFQHEFPCGARFEDATLLANPTALEVASALENALEKMTADSIFVFYFAGHGLLTPTGTQKLLCKDADPALADGVDAPGAISSDFINWFSRRGRGKMFFCFDVCRRDIFAQHRGATARNEGASPFREALRTKGRPESEALRWSLYSCGDGQLSRDDGSFVDALLAEMRAILAQGRELKLGDELVDGVAKRLSALGSRPEGHGEPFVLAPAAAAAASELDALKRELETLRRRVAEFEAKERENSGNA